MKYLNHFLKQASSLSLCIPVAGMMLSSFNVCAAGSYDTLGEKFYDNGDVIYENSSIAGVSSGPSEDVVFEIEETTLITGIWTYHWYPDDVDEWEYAYVWIESEEGDEYGPWSVQAEQGQGGKENVNWYAFPNVTLEPGTYYLYDSNASTWSYAYDTDNKGMCMIRGTVVDGSSSSKTSKSGNLLTNPSFEDGLDGWEDPDGIWNNDPDTTGHDATDGNHFAWPSDGASEDTYIYQDVYVDSDAEGQTAVLSAMLSTFDQNPTDLARLELIFLNSKGKVIDSYSKEQRAIEWAKFTISAEVPDGTTTIRVMLHGIRYNGSIIDSYFDDVSLTLSGDAASSTKNSKSDDDSYYYMFSYYTFTIPSYWGEPEYDSDGTVYFYGEDEYDLPLIMLTYEPIENYFDSGEVNGLTDEEAIEILESFKDTLEEDSYYLSETEEITIAGYPAIIYTATVSLYGDNDIRIAHFMDSDYFYELLLIEYEDSDTSYLEDLDYIVSTFE